MPLKKTKDLLVQGEPDFFFPFELYMHENECTFSNTLEILYLW